MSDQSRREFCSRLLAAGAVSKALLTATDARGGQPANPQNLRVGPSSTLKPSDFTYLGRFTPPIAGREALWWHYRGLSGRIVDGEFRLLGMLDRGSGASEVWLREFAAPSTLSKYPAKAQPATIREWRLEDVVAKAHANRVIEGAWVDPVTQDLYWSHQTGGSYHNTQNMECIGRSRWNGATWVPEGRWSLGQHLGSKLALGAFMEIPEWFRQRHGLGQQRIAAGMGTYRSVMATGPVSMGPALVALTPPTTPSGSDVDQATALMNFKATLGESNYATRDADCAEIGGQHQAILPVNGVGRWGWQDWAGNSGIWIDTPTKSGLLVIGSLASVGGEGNGGVSYIASSPAPTLTATTVSFRLTSPIKGLQPGDFIGIRSTFSQQNGHGRVLSVTNGGLDVECSGWPQNPPYNGTTWDAPYKPAVGGWVCRGTWYSMAMLHCSMWKHGAFLYSPSQFGEVLDGKRQAHTITPDSQWDWKVEGHAYPSRNTLTSSSDRRSIYGMAYDPISRRLYMVVPAPEHDGLHRVIEVYEVAG